MIRRIRIIEWKRIGYAGWLFEWRRKNKEIVFRVFRVYRFHEKCPKYPIYPKYPRYLCALWRLGICQPPYGQQRQTCPSRRDRELWATLPCLLRESPRSRKSQQLISIGKKHRQDSTAYNKQEISEDHPSLIFIGKFICQNSSPLHLTLYTLHYTTYTIHLTNYGFITGSYATFTMWLL